MNFQEKISRIFPEKKLQVALSETLSGWNSEEIHEGIKTVIAANIPSRILEGIPAIFSRGNLEKNLGNFLENFLENFNSNSFQDSI